LHRRSYSIDAKSQPACDLRALYSDGGRAAVHSGKGNRLSPHRRYIELLDVVKRGARTRGIDYHIGRRFAPQLASLGLTEVSGTAGTAIYNGASPRLSNNDPERIWTLQPRC
jgi:hypothetical protein